MPHGVRVNGGTNVPPGQESACHLFIQAGKLAAGNKKGAEAPFFVESGA